MLLVEDLQAAYGDSKVLFGMSLEVQRGQVVTLLGRNGMGKTTTVRTIFGLLKPRGGRVSIDGVDVTGAAPHRIARLGLGLVPEGRLIFPDLTVQENLMATARPGKWDLGRIHAMFPRLQERGRNMGNQLSGGEQQMLAIGRALMTNPDLIVLDEATEGLAPLIREQIWDCLIHLKSEGEAILVIDKNVEALARFADRHYVVEKGQVVWDGSTDDLKSNPQVKDRFLGV
ncbi:ABC transporter ATP-binding protein [Paracoccus sp. SM22M-07]|uniref:ABC transporter ATP-binding protein n=1 Tax=Paracoccus sp. SM22M-07 TaxID=1520813 RepID=UPI000920A9D0|nr:ABC transporter ATP-binding protein [Paracoccus sp. SM22M-07]OJH43094.1 ABC transporter ATP-binding protein [Paracoccus sp. SM22M-07]